MKGMSCGGTISVLLGVAFVILKVIGAINWEWGWGACAVLGVWNCSYNIIFGVFLLCFMDKKVVIVGV